MVAEYKLDLVAKTDFFDEHTEATVVQKLMDMGISVERVYCKVCEGK